MLLSNSMAVRAYKIICSTVYSSVLCPDHNIKASNNFLALSRIPQTKLGANMNLFRANI